jgi:hypothetical protein
MIPTDKVVRVTISTTPRTLTASNFSTLLLVESDAYLPAGQRLRTYPSLSAVGIDHPTDSEFYKAATVFFEQTPGATLLGGRRFATATKGELIGGVYDSIIGHWAAVTTGSLKFALNGAPLELDGLNFASVETMTDVAAVIQAALTTSHPGALISFVNTAFAGNAGFGQGGFGQGGFGTGNAGVGYFYLESDTTGTTSSVGFGVTPAAGVDVSSMLGVTATSNGVLATPGMAGESIAQSLTNLMAINNSWYGLTFTNEIVSADMLAVGAWAEANKKLFGQTTNDVNCVNPYSAEDIGSELMALGYDYSMIQYDPVVEYAAVSYLARLMAVDFTQPDSAITMAFKTEPGIQPANLTVVQTDALDAKNINYFTYFGSTGSVIAVIMNGTQASGQFTDERQGLDWLSAYIGINVFNYLAVNKKVPQTDKGVTRIVNVIEAALAQAVSNGLVADGGVWEGNPIGTVKTGDTLPTPVSRRRCSTRARLLLSLFSSSALAQSKA